MGYDGCAIAVTGADGFIGSHLVEALVRAGARVRALALYSSFDSLGWLDDLAPEVRGQVEIVRGDVRDSGFMIGFLKQQEVCFHLAALIAIPYSYAAPRSYLDTNVIGTLNVMEAARHHGLRRVVHTSTSEVYGSALVEPMDESHPLQGQSPYSASKIGADMVVESQARSFGLPAVTLRPFNTFGPRQSERAVIPTIIRQALDPACDAIRLGDLTTRRDFTFVEDTAAAFLAIGAAPEIAYGTAYNGGTGSSVVIGDVAETVRALCGSNKPIVSEAERLRPEASEVRALIADHGRLTAATGWVAAHSLQQGLDKTVSWWRDRLSRGEIRRDRGYAT